jgi:hypothetical protein
MPKKDETPAPASEAAPPPAPVDPKTPTKVRNHGTQMWLGTDYHGKGGTIYAGETGIVSRAKAEELVQQYGTAGIHGVGPFTIEEESK